MENWKLTIINETKDGYLCMSPNGDTQWLTKEEFQQYEINVKQRCTETQILKKN